MSLSNTFNTVKRQTAICGQICIKLTCMFGVVSGTLLMALSTKHDINYEAFNPIRESHASDNFLKFPIPYFKKGNNFRAAASLLTVTTRKDAPTNSYMMIMPLKP